MRFSLNLRYIFSIYCCEILENIKILGPYKEEIWTPKHWTCNITTGRQLCPKTFGGRCTFLHRPTACACGWHYTIIVPLVIVITIIRHVEGDVDCDDEQEREKIQILVDIRTRLLTGHHTAGITHNHGFHPRMVNQMRTSESEYIWNGRMWRSSQMVSTAVFSQSPVQWHYALVSTLPVVTLTIRRCVHTW